MRYACSALRGLSVRTLGTQAGALQPDAIAKLIEQPGWSGHRRIGGRRVHVQAQLSDMANGMNHEVSARRPRYRTCLIMPLLRQMSDNSR